jgi:hypothetical protein
MRYRPTRRDGSRESLRWTEADLIGELLRIRARLHRLDIATALLLNEIESEGSASEPIGGGLLDPRSRRGGTP